MSGRSGWGRLFLSLVAALLAVSACDSGPEDGEDPSSERGFTAYFPLAVGKAWTFDYERTCMACGALFTPERLEGTLTWRVTDDREDVADARRYTVQETFQGVFTVDLSDYGEEPVDRDSAWATARSFRLSSETMRLDVYTAEEDVEWVAPDAAPSSPAVRFSADTDTLWITHGATGFRLPASLTFVRNRGLVDFFVTDAHGFGSNLGLVLVDVFNASVTER